jgi:hypothetical protein
MGRKKTMGDQVRTTMKGRMALPEAEDNTSLSAVDDTDADKDMSLLVPTVSDKLAGHLKKDDNGNTHSLVSARPDEDLRDDEVRLTDGSIVTLHEEGAWDMALQSSFLTRIGCGNDQYGSEGYGIFRVVMNIVSIDGTPFRKPKNKEEMKFICKQLSGKDTIRLVRGFGKLNAGQEDSSGTFPA